MQLYCDKTHNWLACMISAQNMGAILLLIKKSRTSINSIITSISSHLYSKSKWIFIHQLMVLRNKNDLNCEFIANFSTSIVVRPYEVYFALRIWLIKDWLKWECGAMLQLWKAHSNICFPYMHRFNHSLFMRLSWKCDLTWAATNKMSLFHSTVVS